MRPFLSTLILVLTLPLCEMHTYWGCEKVSNWIINAYRPMPDCWNVKFAVDEIVIIMYFLAWVLYKPNRINRTTVIAFLMLAVLDALLYFYNYKLGGFGLVYYWFAGFWLLVYYWKSLTKWMR